MAPVTVATSTVTTAVSNPQQRAPMFINGVYWLWFSDGTNFKCYSSTDGITFTAASGWVDRAATSANRFSVAYDPVNGKFSYAYTRSSNNYVYWRQGVLNSDGSVAWDAVEQTIVSTLTAPFYPSVDYDGTGKAWVGLTFQYATGDYRWRVYLNTQTNGTWSTDADYPVDLLTGQSASVRGCVLGLTANGAITLYVKTVPVIYAWELDAGGKKAGSSEETASDSTAATVNDWSASKNGNTIILQWHSTNALPHTNQFRCAQRVSGSWGASTQIGTSPNDTGTANIAPVASVDTSTGDIYCVIPKIRTATTYSHYKNGVFVANHEEPTGFYDQLTLQTSLQTYGNKLCIGWLQSGTSPRNVRFESLDVTPPPAGADFVQVM